MRSKLHQHLIVALLATATAVGQQPAAPAVSAESPATREDIQHLFEVTHVHEQMRTTMQLIMAQQQKMIRETIKQRDPQITETEIGKMEVKTRDLVKDLPLDGMLDDMIPVYQKHLTKSDVEAMVSFYSSATGQKLLREQPG